MAGEVAAPDWLNIPGRHSTIDTFDGKLYTNWKANDPMVGDIVFQIENRYPGHVRGIDVGKGFTRPGTNDGITDIDILKKNAAI